MTLTRAQRRNLQRQRKLATRSNMPRQRSAAVPVAPKRKPPRGKGIIGSAIGGFIGGPIGTAIGGFAENALLGLAGQLLGPKAMAAPVAMAGRTSSSQINTSTQHGVEQIATVTVPAGTPAGTIIFQSLIAAPEIGIRLRQNAALWARTIFHRFILVVTSSNPSVVSGNYTTAIDPDPVTQYTSGEELPARLMALVHASKANAWADNAVAAGPNPIVLFNRLDPDTVTPAELRQYAAGQVVVATTTDYASDCEYTLNIIWSVTFENPNTNPSLLPNEDTFYLTSSGKEAIASTTSVIRFNADSSPWANNAPPPVGVYPIAPQECIFLIKQGDSQVERSGDSLEVFDESGELVTAVTLQTPLPNTDPIVILSQDPTIFKFVLPDTFYKIGYAKISRALVKMGYAKGHQQWRLAARQRHINKLVRKAKDDELTRRLVGEFSHMTTAELSLA